VGIVKDRILLRREVEGRDTISTANMKIWDIRNRTDEAFAMVGSIEYVGCCRFEDVR